MVEKYIEILKPKVIEMFKNESSGHDIGHLERAKNTALSLQEKEDGDRVVIGIAAFLHDIHRIMTAESGRYVSPKDSLIVVKKFIDDLDLTCEQKNHIVYAIEHHEEYSFGNEKTSVKDIESLILEWII